MYSMIYTRYMPLLICMASFSVTTEAQQLRFAVGTDVPYQYYVGATWQQKAVDVSFRTGVFTSPYSTLVLNTIEGFGVDEEYISLLDATYNLGWMNSLGMYIKIGKHKRWYVGPEFRLDRLTASDAPVDLIESLTGQPVIVGSRGNRNPEARLGLTLFATGMRVGRSFNIGTRHQIRTEFSFSKYISSTSTLSVESAGENNTNEILGRLLWEDVFKPYGFVGGLGVSFGF